MEQTKNYTDVVMENGFRRLLEFQAEQVALMKERNQLLASINNWTRSAAIGIGVIMILLIGSMVFV